jgi:Ternary complex associated domain 9
MECDHLSLSALDRNLILRAVANSPRVFLAPMDKGLSGSTVWQARWQLPDSSLSKLHVFKIGPIGKLEQEERAILDIASVIDRFSLAHLYRADGSDRALLRQEFAGDPDGSTFSLRNYIRQPSYDATPASIITVVDRLYENRMRAWHYDNRIAPTEYKSIDQAVPWWRSKIDLKRVATELGFDALNEELLSYHQLSVNDLSAGVETALNTRRELSIGPVHGDLHATNVNLDSNLAIYLIDFGNTMYTWRAIDFIILEAAVKFIAAPAHAPLRSLLECERLIDMGAPPSALGPSSFYGTELAKVLAATVRIRHHCVASKAELDVASYRAGLVCVCAAFTSIEWWVNRRFLFHSIAYQLARI